MASSSRRQSLLAGVVLIFLILVGDLITGAVSSHAPGGSSSPGVPLGTWIGMPFNQTELMGNTSYRGMLRSSSGGGESGFRAGLQVGCVNPSNTVGATLQLQYANYSDTTHTNSSNFANILGASIFVDNSANWPCPGSLESGDSPLPTLTTNPTVFIFRVVGSGGGGLGDNPRFSFITTNIQQLALRLPTIVVSTRSSTAFTAFVYTEFPVVIATTENFDWLASTNGVLLESGANSCSIAAAASSCSVSTTFGTNFAGTPNVVCTSRNPSVVLVLAIGTISLLTAQTLTV